MIQSKKQIERDCFTVTDELRENVRSQLKLMQPQNIREGCTLVLYQPNPLRGEWIELDDYIPDILPMINQRGFFNLRTTQWFTLAIDGSAPADFILKKIFSWSLALAPISLMILPNRSSFSVRTTYHYIKELMQKYKILTFNKQVNSSASLKAQVQGLSLPKLVKLNDNERL